MGTRDPRVDAYIDASADFARPILEYLRDVMHTACPEVEETMKWSFPHFMYHGMLAGMAAFKQHCTFGFWKGALVFEEGDAKEGAMGQLGRITSLSDLPSRAALTRYVKRAMKLNEQGVPSPSRSRPKTKRPALPVPSYLKAALARNAKARKAFEGFSPSHRREYVEWITEAKGEETRRRRLETALEWMAEGKTRHWKYARSAVKA